jgi:hypothetical protein
MALATMIGAMPYGFLQGLAGTPQLSSHLIDASGEEVGVVFEVPKTGSIRKIHFRLGTTTTGDTLFGGVYTVDTAGDPTTSAYGSMVAGTLVVANADDNLSVSITLGTDATATQGDMVAVRIGFNSFVAGALNIQSLSGTFSTSHLRPYLTHKTGGTWAKQVTIPLMAIEYSDGTFAPIPGMLPFTAGMTSDSVSSTAAIREIAMLVSLPVPLRLRGIHGAIAPNGATSDYETHVYDSSTADVATALSVAAEMSAAFAQRPSYHHFPRASLSKATTYRLSFKPTSTNAMTVQYGVAPSAAALAQVTGDAGSITYSTRDSGGTWTDYSARMLFGQIVFDQVDDGASAGGSTGGYIF